MQLASLLERDVMWLYQFEVALLVELPVIEKEIQQGRLNANFGEGFWKDPCHGSLWYWDGKNFYFVRLLQSWYSMSRESATALRTDVERLLDHVDATDWPAGSIVNINNAIPLLKG